MGFGGSSGQQVTGYEYYAAFILALCEGPIAGIGRFWVGKTAHQYIDEKGLSAFLGARDQAAWGWATAYHPDQALNYSGLAYVSGPQVDMGDNAAIPNFTFEVSGLGMTAADVVKTISGFNFGFAKGKFYVYVIPLRRIQSIDAIYVNGGLVTGYTAQIGPTNAVITFNQQTQQQQAGVQIGICNGHTRFYTANISNAISVDNVYINGVPQSNWTSTVTPTAIVITLYGTLTIGWITADITITGGYPAGVLTGDFHYLETEYHSSVAGCLDENPAVIVRDILCGGLSTFPGILPASSVGDLTYYSNYCVAMGLLISPAYTSQTAAKDMLAEIAKATNSEFVWSQGKLILIPYADGAALGHGVYFVPNLTPVFDLTDDDFVVVNSSLSTGAGATPQGGGGVSFGGQVDDPILCTRSATADAFNHIQIEYANRAADYNYAIAEAKDQADIENKGLRTQDPIQMHFVCDITVAQTIAQLVLQRTLYIRNTYEFKLGWNYCLLEPMDLVTITDLAMGLDHVPVRIKSIEEDETGLLSITAEECPLGVYAPALYGTGAGGTNTDWLVDPGDVNTPIIFKPPTGLRSGSNPEVWMVVSGGADWGGCAIWVSQDQVNYSNVGTVFGSAKQGVLIASLASHADPDTTNTLSVDLTESNGDLQTYSQTDADNLNSLCYVDGELISYETATLTDVNQYDLTYLRRGAYGTAIASHGIGSYFARLDSRVFKYPYLASRVGQTVYIILQSFNKYGQAYQDMSQLSPVSFTL